MNSHLRTACATLCLTLAFSLPALAQSQLDRMEVLAERAGTLTNEALALQLPQLAGNLPSPDWDDSLRQAYACVLDAYVDASSVSAVDRMMDDMEAALEGATGESILNGEINETIGMPDGMSPGQAQALLGECGVMNIMMMRMAESGAMEIMMQQ